MAFVSRCALKQSFIHSFIRIKLRLCEKVANEFPKIRPRLLHIAT